MRGKNKYVPSRFIETMEKIKNENNLFGKRSDAFVLNKMVDYCNIGLEVERMRDRFILADVFKRKKK